LDSVVTPGDILPRHAEYQIGDLLRDARSTRSLGYRPYTAARQGPMLFETTRQYAEDLSLGSKNEPGKAAERAISQSIEKTRKEVISVLHSLR